MSRRDSMPVQTGNREGRHQSSARSDALQPLATRFEELIASLSNCRCRGLSTTRNGRVRL